MDEWVKVLITTVATVFASAGFWTWITTRRNKKDAKAQMLLGLGHDRITWLCMKYIEQGSISQDEFENLNEYLYKPYESLGGNGSAKRLMEEVRKLKITR